MMPLGTEVGLVPGHIVLDGDPASPSKNGAPPIFGPCLLSPNGWMDQDATRYGALGPGHIVLDGDPVPPKGGAQASQFSAHVCCVQTVGWIKWIKMPLGKEVGLGPAATLC